MIYKEWQYAGPLYKDAKLFRLKRNDVLCSTMAGDSWVSLWPMGKDPIPANKIGNGVLSEPFRIKLVNDGNIQIVGSYYFRSRFISSRKVVVVICSGSGGPAAEYVKEIIEGYLKPELSKYVHGVVSFDYRGFGLSKDPNSRMSAYEPKGHWIPTSRGLYSDTQAVMEYLQQICGMPIERIILHGYSLGSGPATEMAVRHKKLGGLVLHGPMESLYYNAKRDLSEGMGGLIGRVGAKIADLNVGFRNIDKVKSIQAPVCITCGPKDKEMWPQAQNLQKRLVKSKKPHIMAIHDGTHLDTGAPFRNGNPNRPVQPPANSLKQLGVFLQKVSTTKLKRQF